MMYGLNQNGEKILSAPLATSICPLCKIDLIPKCGLINIWHWAHKTLNECDSWHEKESKWHLDWKSKVPKEQCEVRIGKHIADIVNKNKIVIELQNSPISTEEIQEREDYYKNMVWLINGLSFSNNFDIRFKNFDPNEENKAYCTFRWKHPRKSWIYSFKKKYIDFGNTIFHIKKIYSDKYCGGWGYASSPTKFEDRYIRCIDVKNKTRGIY